MQLFYTVKPGDTLTAIAKRWEIPVPSFIAANLLENPDQLHPGQQLAIPPGVTRVLVRAGDSVFSLAQAHGVPMEAIIEANRLRPPYTIFVGQWLHIPPGVPYYTVQPGDSLYLLARRYHVTTNGRPRPELIQQVNLLPSDVIYIGMRLLIPYAPPGGQGLLAYTASFGADYDLWLYDPASGRSRAVGRAQAAQHSVPYWSPNDRYIAFIGKQNVLFVLDVQQGALLQVDQLEPYTSLSWSPDSRIISYPKQGQIVQYAPSTFARSSIPAPGVKFVQWLPSGDRLIYTAPDSAGNDQIFELRSDGTGRRQLTNNQTGPMNEVQVSPDGTNVLYTSPGASISIIYVAELATGRIIELTGGPLAKNYFPDWSPQSDTIAFSATEYTEQKGYYSTVRIERAQGGGQQILSVSDCFVSPVSWTPDGASITYAAGCRETGAAPELWLVNVQRPAPIRLVAGARAITNLEWSHGPVPAAGFATYRNAAYQVRFPYPASWRAVTETRYEGMDGFFEISAIASELPLHELCQEEANHQLKPYGSSPRVVPARVQGQEACYIFPSADQAPELRRQSALIAVYPEPVTIQGSTYNYFILWADEGHLQSIVSGLRFEPPTP